MTTPFIVGAYASLPSTRDAQENYYRLLSDQEWIRGLEIPYPGNLVDDLPWLASNIPSHWDRSVITAIPGTMQNVGKNPAFGLASSDREGRGAALLFADTIRRAVGELADIAQCPLISFVELHSAPTAAAHAAAFEDSLGELAERDWSGAQLVIEHCDAPRSGRTPEKGFLEIGDEITIAASLNLSVTINWGRSCLEERDADAPLAHIREASARGVLGGVVFSGAGPEATEYGYEWQDGHLPASFTEPTSLMTPERIRTCAQEAGSASYMGAKICVPASASLEERLAMLTGIYEATRA